MDVPEIILKYNKQKNELKCIDHLSLCYFLQLALDQKSSTKILKKTEYLVSDHFYDYANQREYI